MGNPTLNLKPGAEWVPESNVDVARSDVDFSTGGFCEGVAYDVLAYYVPYSTNSNRRWGIYFVRPNMERDLSNLARQLINSSSNRPPSKGKYLVMLIYPQVLFLHELCHHTLENVRFSMDPMPSSIYEPSDEGLCNYVAFRLVEESSEGSLVTVIRPFIIDHGDHIHIDWYLPMRWLVIEPVYHRFTLPWPYGKLGAILMAFNGIGKPVVREALSILYRWWGLDKPSLYKPVVSTNYGEDFLEAFINQLRSDLIPFLDNVLSTKPVSGSIWARIDVDDRELKVKCPQGQGYKNKVTG